MSVILAIDPGSAKSAWLMYDLGTDRPLTPSFGILPNDELLAWLRRGAPVGTSMTTLRAPGTVVIEWIQSYGMAVGAEVFETCRWVGRFAEALERAEARVEYVTRMAVKTHLCNSAKAKDTNVHQALIDRFGGIGGKAVAVGLKASPGPLYGVANDVWAALAVAVTWADTRAGT